MTSLDWDPRSYLADAAAHHVATTSSVDAESSATTIVNYYDYVANHLEQSERSQTISAVQRAQRGQTSPTTMNCVVVEGVAMCVPYRIIGSLATPSETEDAHGNVQASITKTVEDVFGAMEEIFGHHEGSRIRQLTDTDFAEGLCDELLHVLSIGCRLTELTGGAFTMFGKRLMSTYCRAVDADNGGDRFQQFVQPSQKESAFHREYLLALHDLASTIALNVEQRSLRKPYGLSIDVDGIAKGFVVDKLIEALRNYGGDSENGVGGDGNHLRGALVEWGGDICVFGKPPLPPVADSASDPAVSHREHWVVGIICPPKLDAVYSRWKSASKSAVKSSSSSLVTDIDEDNTKEYLSEVQLSNELPAIATSGDYNQTRRYGYTHIVDAASGAIARAHGRELASVSVLSTSAAWADGLSTALFATRQQSRMLQLVPTLRSAGLVKFYAYIRHKQTLLADVDDMDEEVTTGDAERLAAADPRSHLQHALHSVAYHHGQGSRGAARHDALVERVSRGKNADAFHHITHAERNDSVLTIRCDPPMPTQKSHQQWSATSLSDPTQALKDMCSLTIPHHIVTVVFESETKHVPDSGVKRDTGDTQTPLLHAVPLSSVVFCASSSSEVSLHGMLDVIDMKHEGSSVMVSFNVMRGTALYNAVVGNSETQEDRPLVLHWMSSHGDVNGDKRDTSGLARLSFPGSVKVSAGRRQTTDVATTSNSAPSLYVAWSDRPLMPLGSQTLIAVVRTRVVAGDHALVVAECFLPTSIEELQRSDSLECRESFDAAHCEVELPLSMTTKSLFPVCPVVVVARHRQHGTVAFPAFGLRMCSEQPLMVSLLFVQSTAADVAVQHVSMLANAEIAILVPSATCPWFDGGGDDEWLQSISFPIHTVMRWKADCGGDRATTGRGMNCEILGGAAEHLVASMRCTLIDVIAAPHITDSEVQSQNKYAILMCAVSRIELSKCAPCLTFDVTSSSTDLSGGGRSKMLVE